MILAIDTTGPHGSLALDAVEVRIHAPDGYGGVLFAEMERLLMACGATLRDVDCFAAAAGPGTFTGVRTGLSCAMGLAEAMGKPLCAVSNLEAIAEFGTAAVRAVSLDARRGEIYAAVYGEAGRVIVPGAVWTPAAFQAALPPGEVEWVRYDGPLAAAMARIAKRKPWMDPAAVDADYLRRTDAELNLGPA